MLHGKHCRRNKYGALLSAYNALHRRAKSNLGLSEAYVAAEKSVHWTRSFHILLYLAYGLKLIVGFGIRKPRLKISLRLIVRQKSDSLALLSFCVKLYQLMGHILYRPLYAAARFLPFGGGKLIELYSRVVPRTDIF